MNFEQQMYEVKEKWEESYFSDLDRKRIEYITKIIPAEAKTLLDVGCGNGILINYLSLQERKFDRICGTDRSQTSLQFVKTEKYESEITHLPFKDGEFDVVTCLEVIEHLPQEVFSKALEELLRASSKYLIISVPFNEDLDFSKVRCIKCATEFNPFYHMHSFDAAKLSALYNGRADKINVTLVDKVESVRLPHFRFLKKWISRKINGASFPPNCICPMCGYNEFKKLAKVESANPTQEASSGGGLSRYWPHYNAPKWVVAVFEKG